MRQSFDLPEVGTRFQDGRRLVCSRSQFPKRTSPQRGRKTNKKKNIINVVSIKSRHRRSNFDPEKPGAAKVGYPPIFALNPIKAANIFLTLL